ncbi:unnamed protein product [Rotaria magnacalcarata]|uniref:Uncharacterized protein n=1 Tax=Rotaria magnacalcarata TaxID=392030 RepID=A0A820LNS9_9BILA|nr:unnamed protein product [Rotaria magnacalcarata]CAF4359992.1 unnamed protein product [Rotaria magnacalcarata]
MGSELMVTHAVVVKDTLHQQVLVDVEYPRPSQHALPALIKPLQHVLVGEEYPRPPQHALPALIKPLQQVLVDEEYP